jgi:DNA modification methylase
LKGLILGDGHKRKDDKRISFIQKDKECVDWFEILAMRCGYHTVTSKKGNGWITYLTKRTAIGIRNTNGKGKAIKKIYYKGKIWCPRTPNSTWIAKRNGRVFITGNTFPPRLVEPMIKAGCPQCGIVLDPFSGSGTTGVVARKLGRNFIGIDLNREYLDMSIKRLEKERRLL